MYVTGDSFSFGQGLMGHNLQDFYNFTEALRRTSYSGILADKLQIQEYKNTSMPGCSNDRLLRKVLIDVPEILTKVRPDELFINVSLTHAARTEFYSTEAKRYIPMIPNFNPGRNRWKSQLDMWKIYVGYFDDVKEHVDRWLINLISMQKFLDSLGVKYLITRSMPEHHTFHTELEKEIYRHPLRNLINKKTFPDELEPFNQFIFRNNLKFTKCLHADEEGHRRWAEHLLKYIMENNIL